MNFDRRASRSGGSSVRLQHAARWFRPVGQFKVQLKLSCRYRKTPSELSDWTAVAVTNEGDLPLGTSLPEKPVEIRIPQRTPAKAYVFRLSWLMNGSKAVFTFGAASGYPEKNK